MITSRFNLDLRGASIAFTIPALIGIITAPMTGKISDKVNKRGYTLIICGVIFVFVHCYMAFMSDCEKCYEIMKPLILNNINMMFLTTNFWAAARLVMIKGREGEAIGILNCLLCFMNFLSTLVLGYLLDNGPTL